MRVAVRHNCLRHLRADAGDVFQQRRRRGVQIHAHAVHGGFDDGIQRLAEGFLVDVMLIQSHADGLWLDLHQLRQRILKAPGDGDRAAQRHIQVGQLLPRQLRSGVDGRARFVDDGVLDRQPLADEPGYQRLGLAAGSAVPNGDDGDAMRLRQLAQRLFRLGLMAVGVDGDGGEHLAGGIHHGDLAAGADAGINAEHGLPAQRRLQQQGAQVGGKDADGVRIGDLGQRAADVALHGGEEQPGEGIFAGGAQLLAERAARVGREVARQNAQAFGFGDLQTELKDFLPLAPVQR